MRQSSLLYRLNIVLGSLIALLLLTQPDVRAEEAKLGVLDQALLRGPTASDLVGYAYETNPRIEAARHNWRAVVEKYRVATAYPDPMLSATYFPRPIETRLGPQDFTLNISQSIPFPGKLSQSGKIVEQEAKIARLMLDLTVRDVSVAVRESFHELAYIQKAKEVAAQNRRLLDHLRKFGETAFAKDKATLLDVVKAQSQTGQLLYDDILLADLEQTELAKLNSLLNRQADAPLGSLAVGPPRTMSVPLNELYRLSLNGQEEILIAQAKIRQAEENTSLAQYRYWPDFKFGLFYSFIGEPDTAVRPDDAGRDAIGVQAGITIPLWFGRNQGRVEQARAMTRSAQAQKRNQVNAARAKIRTEYFHLKNAERLIKLYRTNLVPQAAKSLEIAETWYRNQQGGFSDFIEAQAVLYNFQLALARAEADHGRSLARLEGLTGSILTGSGLTGSGQTGSGAGGDKNRAKESDK